MSDDRMEWSDEELRWHACELLAAEHKSAEEIVRGAEVLVRFVRPASAITAGTPRHAMTRGYTPEMAEVARRMFADGHGAGAIRRQLAAQFGVERRAAAVRAWMAHGLGLKLEATPAQLRAAAQARAALAARRAA